MFYCFYRSKGNCRRDLGTFLKKCLNSEIMTSGLSQNFKLLFSKSWIFPDFHIFLNANLFPEYPLFSELSLFLSEVWRFSFEFQLFPQNPDHFPSEKKWTKLHNFPFGDNKVLFYPELLPQNPDYSPQNPGFYSEFILFPLIHFLSWNSFCCLFVLFLKISDIFSLHSTKTKNSNQCFKGDLDFVPCCQSRSKYHQPPS